VKNKKPNNGGPAFPSCADDLNGDPCTGMTLRDYFAAKAMQAIVGNMNHTENLIPETADEERQSIVYTFPSTQPTCLGDQRETAQTAYALADAMLAAREAK
jgi:hypothetical protein